MIVGLQLGKETSTGLPGKNYMKIMGRRLNEYSLLAGYHCKYIDKLYTSTDSPTIKSGASKFEATIIDRPPELARPETLTEDVLTHAYKFIINDLGETPEIIVLLFANAPTVDLEKLYEGIEILLNDPSLDSCFSVVRYNMFSPTRAKGLSANNILQPFVNLKYFQNISSIRSSQGDVYFVDFTIQIMRPTCFVNMDEGTPPLKWMGKKTYGLEVDFGFDIDEEWQIPVIEYWLKKAGFTNTKIPW